VPVFWVRHQKSGALEAFEAKNLKTLTGEYFIKYNKYSELSIFIKIIIGYFEVGTQHAYIIVGAKKGPARMRQPVGRKSIRPRLRKLRGDVWRFI